MLQAYRRKFEIEPLLREKPTQEEEVLQNTRTRATVSPLQLSTFYSSSGTPCTFYLFLLGRAHVAGCLCIALPSHAEFMLSCYRRTRHAQSANIKAWNTTRCSYDLLMKGRRCSMSV